jgi:hypothetical protein
VTYQSHVDHLLLPAHHLSFHESVYPTKKYNPHGLHGPHGPADAASGSALVASLSRPSDLKSPPRHRSRLVDCRYIPAGLA